MLQLDDLNDIIPDELLHRAMTALGSLADKAKDFAKKIPEALLPLFENMTTALKKAIKFNTFGLEVDELTMEQFVEFIKNHIVKGCNQSVAIKCVEEDGIFIYVTFAHDRELLPEDKNKTLIIKAKTLASEVSELFGENELIILN